MHLTKKPGYDPDGEPAGDPAGLDWGNCLKTSGPPAFLDLVQNPPKKSEINQSD